VSTSAEIAYFSMEIALDPALPTYSGGLGVLAGDTIRSAADLGIPMVGVTLLHRRGYFEQRLDERGQQHERPCTWSPEDRLELLSPRASVEIEGRTVALRAWCFRVTGTEGHAVTVYLLDTDLDGNDAWDRTLTDTLYGGDERYRLAQEMVLGLGGVRMLRALGHTAVRTFHMNEGHAALLAVALLAERKGGAQLGSITEADIDAVRRQCVFTTHTPVPAGHDQFPRPLVRDLLGRDRVAALEASGCCSGERLNMTYVALRFSHYINGVAMRHGLVSQGMFPDYPIRAITNGVHAVTWTAAPFRELYDRHIPEWRRDNLYLRYAVGIGLDEVRSAHDRAKSVLLDEVRKRVRSGIDPQVFTIGFARRAAAYKRADLVFSDLHRLRGIARRVGPLQLLFAGKAHPRDEEGKKMIRRVFEAASFLRGDVAVTYLEGYDMHWAQLLTSGVDLWLNTPQRPEEASGTSGMKAALNGIPSLSVRDGWWVEGHFEGITGWSIGDEEKPPVDPAGEAGSLYQKLESGILPTYYGRPAAWANIMRSAIAVNGAFFNTQRMLSQYVANAYSREPPGRAGAPAPERVIPEAVPAQGSRRAAAGEPR
jgi:starch phosphorylase